MENDTPDIKISKKKRWIITAAAVAAVIIAVSCWGMGLFSNTEESAKKAVVSTGRSEVIETPRPTVKAVVTGSGKQPSDRSDIDFEELLTINEDLVAWISVPGTSVDYPVVYREDDNFYYLDIDFEGNDSLYGAIYVDIGNQKDFTDPLTVVYGHNMKDGSMFASLHSFEDTAFFEQNDEIKLYFSDGNMMIYQIFAAYKTGDDNILYGKDYSDGDTFEEWIDATFSIRDMSANIREMDITPDDRVLLLSTCVRGEDEARYIVAGVLQENNLPKTIPDTEDGHI